MGYARHEFKNPNFDGLHVEFLVEASSEEQLRATDFIHEPLDWSKLYCRAVLTADDVVTRIGKCFILRTGKRCALRSCMEVARICAVR